jgi:hypothetical protein
MLDSSNDEGSMSEQDKDETVMEVVKKASGDVIKAADDVIAAVSEDYKPRSPMSEAENKLGTFDGGLTG